MYGMDDMQQLKLPDFVGIGAQRSGTTWIYEMLRSHPDVCMSPEKEINFFNESYDKGVGWYARYFAKCADNTVTGEFSPRYLSDPNTPERMKDVLPDAKLIVSLRNPADEVYSRYCYMVTRQMHTGTFENTLAQQTYLIEQAYYYQHLVRFLKYYKRENVLILIYDDLLADPRAFLQGIYSFLGVDSNYLPPHFFEKIHSNRVAKSKVIETGIVAIRGILRHPRLLFLVEGLKKLGVDKRIKQFNASKQKSFAGMDAQTRKYLHDVFAEDKKMLGELLGRDLSFWS